MTRSRKAMRGCISGWRRLCLMTLAGMCVTGFAAQTPTVSSPALGWTQNMADADVSSMAWAVIVDGDRRSWPSVICTPTTTANRYTCRAPIPALTPGLHTVQVIAISASGQESPPSTPKTIRVDVVMPRTSGS